MTVWIEYAFLQNCIVDFTLLYLTAKTVKIPLKKLRAACSVLLGGMCALVFPLLTFCAPLAFFFRLASGLLLPLVAFSAAEKQQILLSEFFFFLYTFCLGGLITALYDLAQTLPLSLPSVTLCALPLFLIFIYNGISRFIKKLSHRAVHYACKIEYDGKTHAVTALLDTGNELKYEEHPVCLLDKPLAKSMDVQFIDYMYVQTVTGRSLTGVFQADLKIYSGTRENIIKKVYFAVSPAPLGGKYGLILQPLLMKEEDDVQRLFAKNLFIPKKKSNE